MKNITLLLTICLSLLMTAHAQSSLSGSVVDTVNYKPMAYSSVVLVRTSDSILIAHQWLSQEGSFAFYNLPAGAYSLRITRPTFADYEESITLADNENKRVGNIIMVSKANLLRDVIIREKRNAITIKGDTTEFFVDSFLVNKNSNVEDLLKRLPGLQVDKDGKITAQGQEVKKVLVDGEEFFGDDPTVATRNLRADNVEAVQVFDKKSDQAAFTGIDDGVKEKTINLKLKADAKKGYFGKASAGVGTQDRYEHDAMVNAFKNKRKVSAFAATSNTNKTGLSWEDNRKYGSNDNTFVDEESGAVYTYYNSGGESFDGVGIPQTTYAGAVYADKFKTDTHSVNTSFKYQDLKVSGFNNNYTKYILPDTLYYNNQLNNFSGTKQLISGNGKYEWKLDSLTTIKVSASAKQLQATNTNQYTTENLNGDGVKVNENSRTQENANSDNTYTIALNIGHRFKTKGRSLSLNADQMFFNGKSDGFLRSQTNFYDGDGSIAKQNIIDQKKVLSSKVNNLNVTVTYTEPLSSKWFIVADAYSKINVNESERISLDKGLNGDYTEVVDSLSNGLHYDIYTNRGGLALKYNTKKIVWSLGGKASYTDLSQRDIESSLVKNQTFLNVYPAASFQYKIRSTASLSLSYNGRTTQPSLQQIQPIIDNANPLDLTIGNPNLEQSFSNSFSMTYNNYKPVTGTSLYMNASYWFSQNDFTNFDIVDNFGRKLHQTVNVDGNKRANFYSYYWFKIRSSKFSSSVNFYGNYSENHNFINTQANTNYNINIEPNLGVYYEIEDKFELRLSGNWDYFNSKSSLRKDVVTQYWVSTYSIDAEWTIKKKYEIGSDCNFNYRQQTSAFNKNYNTIIWNAYVSRTFLKADNLELRLACKDMLNQNIGFRRNTSSNYVNENTYSILKRYFMVSLTWNFTKGGAGGSAD
jgi:hypothetical protein